MQIPFFPKYLGVATLVALLGSQAWAEDHKRIFFGDLHTHSNLSADAVLMQLAHGVERGPEAACLYAMACAKVDFYGQSDHAEMLDKTDWDRSVAAVKACNEMGQDIAGPQASEPALVAFQGFEWTSSAKGLYWGHKNVFFKNDTVPEMPVAAYSIGEVGAADIEALIKAMAIYERIGVTVGPAVRASARSVKINARKRCAEGTDGRRCIRVADEPRDLWRALNSYFKLPEYQAGDYDALVIPHGTAWGMAKVGTDWDIQLNPEQHDPNLQRIIEVYSGHGNSEEYRDFATDKNYESCHERAARLQGLWCRKNGVEKQSCLPRIEQALASATVPFPTKPRDWGQCSQCTDCFQPAERYYPDGSVQAALAKTGFGSDGEQTRYHFGFIAATDDHASRPAGVMESRALADWGLPVFLQATIGTTFAPEGRNPVESERVSSYFYPGGLVAVHATTRSRDAIWAGLKSREVYGTSGPRISLWYHAEANGHKIPMGERITATASPTFSFEVWGGPEELPGCSTEDRNRWGDETVDNICLNSCYNPGNRRIPIDRVEIVKITPQHAPDEQISMLIQDPYRVITNTSQSAQFKGQFADPDYAEGGRDAIYYIRAVQQPTPAVNGDPMRHTQTGSLEPCPLYYEGNDCMAMTEERAWSSPIYVDFLKK